MPNSSRPVAPHQWLAVQKKPQFKDGNTLPPLTRFGWSLPFEVKVELARDWGYALEFEGNLTDVSVEESLRDPGSSNGRLLELVRTETQNYKLAVVCNSGLFTNGPESADPQTFLRDDNGNIITYKASGIPIWSPEAPIESIEIAAELRAAPLRALNASVPISIILNPGEYALGVAGYLYEYVGRDPVVLAARGYRPLFSYLSEKKGEMERVIADSIRKAVPQRDLYIYYSTGSGGRNQSADWRDWSFGYEWIREVSDLPSTEYYYKHFNTGWTGDNDMLSRALNSRGLEISCGDANSYDWLCGGWQYERGERVCEPDNPAALVDVGAGEPGDIDLYEGFLKCLYTAGAIGGIAGYYALPSGGFGAAFPEDNPPHWLRQLVKLSEVHALFSHLESFLRQGILLTGPLLHKWSDNQPAYEFPTGYRDTRLLCRQLSGGKSLFLLTAWAADGEAKEITAVVPELGEIGCIALPSGAVYIARLSDDGKPKLTILSRSGSDRSSCALLRDIELASNP